MNTTTGSCAWSAYNCATASDLQMTRYNSIYNALTVQVTSLMKELVLYGQMCEATEIIVGKLITTYKKTNEINS